MLVFEVVVKESYLSGSTFDLDTFSWVFSAVTTNKLYQIIYDFTGENRPGHHGNVFGFSGDIPLKKNHDFKPQKHSCWMTWGWSLGEIYQTNMSIMFYEYIIYILYSMYHYDSPAAIHLLSYSNTFPKTLGWKTQICESTQLK